MNNDHLFISYILTLILAIFILSACAFEFTSKELGGKAEIDPPRKATIEVPEVDTE